MRLRNKLLLLGLPLVVLPALASLAIFSTILVGAARETKTQVLDARLGLVQSRVDDDYRLLSRVGLARDASKQDDVVRQLSKTLLTLQGDDAVVILDTEGRVLVGPPGWEGFLVEFPEPLHAVFEDLGGHLLVTNPMSSEPGRWMVSYGRFVEWNWVLMVMTPESRAYESIFEAVTASSVTTVGFLTLAVAVFFVFSRRVTRPLVQLQELAAALGGGELHRRATVQTRDEVGDLALAWNAMADQLEVLTEGLELRVKERTRELEDALETTQTMQSHLVTSEKMAALGQLVAGIAHELNSPLGSIASANGLLDEALGDRLFATLEQWSHLSPVDRQVVQSLLAQTAPLARVMDSKHRFQVQRELRERLEAGGLVSFQALERAGELAEAGVQSLDGDQVQCLVGPSGALSAAVFSQIAMARLSHTIIETAVEKSTKVIRALRVYGRREDQYQVTCVPLVENLDVVLTLFHSRLREGIEVRKAYAAESFVEADPDRLNQLWINLIGNAIQSMDGNGTLELVTRPDGEGLIVDIIDSGPGIPVELQHRMFTPFFTTKKRGEGTGLGLQICQSIVAEFSGTITFVSVPGRTVFSVRFPCRCL